MIQLEYTSARIDHQYPDEKTPEEIVEATGNYVWQERLHEELNKYGLEGWELVSMEVSIWPKTNLYQYFAIFKRPKEMKEQG